MVGCMSQTVPDLSGFDAVPAFDDTSDHPDTVPAVDHPADIPAPRSRKSTKTPTAPVPDEPRTPRPRRSTEPTDHTLVKRVAQKAQDLAGAAEEERSLLAFLLGTETSIGELTVAVFNSSRSSWTVVADLNSVADADPVEAGVIAATLGRPRMKAVWGLLAELGAAQAGMPAIDVKAAVGIAKAAAALLSTDRERVEAAVALGRRS